MTERQMYLTNRIVKFKDRLKGGKQFCCMPEFDPNVPLDTQQPPPPPVTVDRHGQVVSQQEINQYDSWCEELEELNIIMDTQNKPTETQGPLLTVFVCGVTNTGKSTFIDDLLKDMDEIQANEQVADKLVDAMGEGNFITSGAVQVGKEMRKLYPPEAFEGKGAMQSTEHMALKIYREGIEKHANKDLVIVDGQPRMRSQIPAVLDLCKGPAISRFFVFLNCSNKEIARRISKRDGSDPEKLKLSQKRMDNDKIQLYEVLTDLICAREYVCCVNSGSPEELAVVIRSVVARVLASKLAREIEKEEGLNKGAADMAANHIIGEALTSSKEKDQGER